MFLLYTDFGLQGPYVGQLHMVLAQQAPTHRVIDLMHDAPRFNPGAAGRLLTALVQEFPVNSICLGIIDPGVGGPRRAIAVQASGHWFIGPDNGLFDGLGHVDSEAQWFEISWRPEALSTSFHGRDLFAPVAAAIATQQAEGMLKPITAPVISPPDFAEIIYIDSFGNAMTGITANRLQDARLLSINGQVFEQVQTFSDRPAGAAFWYSNSLGLAELAINQGSAADTLKLRIGDTVQINLQIS